MELVEYEEYELELKENDLRYLSTLAEANKITLQPLWNGKYKIKTSYHVGFIQLSTRRLYFKPKIPLASIFFLLNRVETPNLYHPKHIPPAWFDTDKFDHLAFVKLFIQVLADFFKEGMRRGYVTKQEELNMVQGKIVMHENIRRGPWQRQTLICEYDDFTFDIRINQIIKFTLNLLRRSVKQHSILKVLRGYERRFKEVQLIREITGTDIDEIVLDRNLDHYKAILSYCKLIIENLSLDEQEGNYAVSSFMINMNYLYERYIFIIVESYFQTFNVYKETIPVMGTTSGKDRVIVVEPDVNVREYSTLKQIFVADAKYKFIDFSQRKLTIQDDFYQILSYALFTKSRHAILFYPNPKPNQVEPIYFTFEEYDTKIMVISVPLGGTEWFRLDQLTEDSLKIIEEWIVST